MLEKGYCHIIGSDAHNNAKRNFCLKDAYDLLSKYDKNIVEDLIYNSKSILDNKEDLKNIEISKQGFLRRFFGK